jgi:hypothetical protein
MSPQVGQTSVVDSKIFVTDLDPTFQRVTDLDPDPTFKSSGFGSDPKYLLFLRNNNYGLLIAF